MNNLTDKNFGLVIAYLVPGFIAICGASFQSPTIKSWIAGDGGVSVGGFLYSSLAAIFVGLLSSTVRWLVLDRINEWTGIIRPNWDFSRLQANSEAFTLLNENQYRYYQFYGNSLFAWLFAYGCWRTAYLVSWPAWPDVGALAISSLLFLGSRDTLRKYYERLDLLLNQKLTGLVIASPFNLPK
ncbi:hypothetical protein [Rubripirellula reticaptiva]|uniref:Uncharacterized protein n=1 Tax=Rubripirellula reticaptiva TaxID=2528013 RepID=A0A5C6F5Y1_9BACT|nr:hypothetical protein [Rubripirellula reticaptiva]TWU55934.1 hypothetical protein Poly59_22370 [Rubripirellula reticaptiva]